MVSRIHQAVHHRLLGFSDCLGAQTVSLLEDHALKPAFGSMAIDMKLLTVISALVVHVHGSIHVLILVGVSANSQLDLDIYGIWNILSFGLLSVVPVCLLS